MPLLAVFFVPSLLKRCKSDSCVSAPLWRSQLWPRRAARSRYMEKLNPPSSEPPRQSTHTMLETRETPSPGRTPKK
eukprot:5951062-Amphidinium_carterae.1